MISSEKLKLYLKQYHDNQVKKCLIFLTILSAFNILICISNTRGIPWVFIFIFCGIVYLMFCIIFLISYIQVRLRHNRLLSQYDEEEWLSISNEVEEATDIQLNKKNQIDYVFTQNYLVGGIMDLSLIRFRDIKWIYKIDTYYKGVIKLGTTIAVHTENRKKILFNSKDADEFLFKIMKKNPNVRVGFSDENKNTMK